MNKTFQIDNLVMFYCLKYTTPHKLKEPYLISEKDWYNLVGVKISNINNILMKSDLIRIVNEKEYILNKLKLVDFQTLCISNNLSMEGTKADLYERIKLNKPEVVYKPISLVNIEFQITEKGKNSTLNSISRIKELFSTEQSENDFSTKKLKKIIYWISLTAIGGYIGNEADRVVLDFLNSIRRMSDRNTHSTFDKDFQIELYFEWQNFRFPNIILNPDTNHPITVAIHNEPFDIGFIQTYNKEGKLIKLSVLQGTPYQLKNGSGIKYNPAFAYFNTENYLKNHQLINEESIKWRYKLYVYSNSEILVKSLNNELWSVRFLNIELKQHGKVYFKVMKLKRNTVSNKRL